MKSSVNYARVTSADYCTIRLSHDAQYRVVCQETDLISVSLVVLTAVYNPFVQRFLIVKLAEETFIRPLASEEIRTLLYKVEKGRSCLTCERGRITVAIFQTVQLA